MFYFINTLLFLLFLKYGLNLSNYRKVLQICQKKTCKLWRKTITVTVYFSEAPAVYFWNTVKKCQITKKKTANLQEKVIVIVTLHDDCKMVTNSDVRRHICTVFVFDGLCCMVLMDKTPNVKGIYLAKLFDKNKPQHIKKYCYYSTLKNGKTQPLIFNPLLSKRLGLSISDPTPSWNNPTILV